MAAAIGSLPFVEDPLLFAILCSLPVGFVGVVALSGGIAAATARITLSDAGVVARAPEWRGTPLPPVREVVAPWSGVLAVRRRIELYRPFVGAFPVQAWRLETTQGTVVFGGRILAGVADAMAEIARRAALRVVDEGEVEVGLARALLHGTPEWQGSTAASEQSRPPG